MNTAQTNSGRKAVDKKYSPLPGESPEMYIKRVDQSDADEDQMTETLISHFDLSEGDAKKLKLESQSFWERFFTRHLVEMQSRHGSRYGALRYVQQKNVQLSDGSKMFSKKQIDDLIDSIGEWKS